MVFFLEYLIRIILEVGDLVVGRVGFVNLGENGKFLFEGGIVGLM